MQGTEDSNDEEVRNYEKLARKARELFATGKNATQEAVDRALDDAAAQLEKAGQLTREEAAKAKQALRRDLAATKADIQADIQKAVERLRQAADPSRVSSGFLSLATHAAEVLGEKLTRWARETGGGLTCHTGEVSGPGTLTCTSCGSEMHFADAGKIPPCPKCHKTEFTKSY